jgi:SAM-dependent methyltransferase
MNWLFKAIVFKVMSCIPFGNTAYRFLQDHLTKSLVASRSRVLQKAEIGNSYWEKFQNLEVSKESLKTHLDLGSGWHPTIPLLFEGYGVERQFLCDVVPIITPTTFKSTQSIFNQLVGEGNFPKCKPSPLNDAEVGNLSEIMSVHGMSYHAPYFGIGSDQAGKIDFVSCTQVLLHIDRPQLIQCFQEMFKVLRTGGWFICTNHLFDIYSNTDKSISIYNHLRYSERFWKTLVNSKMMSFNRLKSRDYREALESTGFEIIEFDITYGDETDLKSLEGLKIHKEFSERYTEKELSEQHLYFVARKP